MLWHIVVAVIRTAEGKLLELQYSDSSTFYPKKTSAPPGCSYNSTHLNDVLVSNMNNVIIRPNTGNSNDFYYDEFKLYAYYARDDCLSSVRNNYDFSHCKKAMIIICIPPKKFSKLRPLGQVGIVQNVLRVHTYKVTSLFKLHLL